MGQVIWEGYNLNIASFLGIAWVTINDFTRIHEGDKDHYRHSNLVANMPTIALRLFTVWQGAGHLNFWGLFARTNLNPIIDK